MATALLVTFTAFNRDENGHDTMVGISSNTMTFVDVKPAERALDLLKVQFESTWTQEHWIRVDGTILKDIVI